MLGKACEVESSSSSSSSTTATTTTTTTTIPFHSSTASLSESACEQLSGSD